MHPFDKANEPKKKKRGDLTSLPCPRNAIFPAFAKE